MAKAIRVSAAIATATTPTGMRPKIEVKAQFIPNILLKQAYTELRSIIPNLPPKLSYPLDEDIIPEEADLDSIDELMLQYIIMQMNEIKGPACEVPCIVGGQAVCCDDPPPPSLMAAPSNIIIKNAYVVPKDFDLTFFDENNTILAAVQANMLDNTALKYYRVVDEEILDHIDIKVGEQYQYII